MSQSTVYVKALYIWTMSIVLKIIDIFVIHLDNGMNMQNFFIMTNPIILVSNLRQIRGNHFNKLILKK